MQLLLSYLIIMGGNGENIQQAMLKSNSQAVHLSAGEIRFWLHRIYSLPLFCFSPDPHFIEIFTASSTLVLRRKTPQLLPNPLGAQMLLYGILTTSGWMLK